MYGVGRPAVHGCCPQMIKGIDVVVSGQVYAFDGSVLYASQSLPKIRLNLSQSGPLQITGAKDTSRTVLSGLEILGSSGAGVSISGVSSMNGRARVELSQNVITANGGAGVSIGSDASGVKLSGNSVYGNTGNGIDLNADGISTASSSATTACPSSGSANGGPSRPTLKRAVLSGSTLSLSGWTCGGGSYDVELYKAEVGTGDDALSSSLDGRAGEGKTYLGKLSGVSGAFSGTLDVSGVTGLSDTDEFTALVIDTVTGNASEFSRNYKGADVGLTVSASPNPVKAGKTVSYVVNRVMNKCVNIK